MGYCELSQALDPQGRFYFCVLSFSDDRCVFTVPLSQPSSSRATRDQRVGHRFVLESAVSQPLSELVKDSSEVCQVRVEALCRISMWPVKSFFTRLRRSYLEVLLTVTSHQGWKTQQLNCLQVGWRFQGRIIVSRWPCDCSGRLWVTHSPVCNPSKLSASVFFGLSSSLGKVTKYEPISRDSRLKPIGCWPLRVIFYLCKLRALTFLRWYFVVF